MKVKLKIEIPQSIIDQCVNNGVPEETIKKTLEHLLEVNALERFFPDDEDLICEEIIQSHMEETSGE